MLLYGIKHDIQYVDTYLFTCVKYKTDAILKMHHNYNYQLTVIGWLGIRIMLHHDIASVSRKLNIYV